MTILSKVLIATGFVYASYHINNLVQEYKEYSAEQGYTLGDFGFEQSGELTRQKKKVGPAGMGGRGGAGGAQQQAVMQQMYFEELSTNSQRGKAAVDKGDYKTAFSCFERIAEIASEYPPFAQYGRNATLYLVKIAQEAKEDELFIKYCKHYLDLFENPSSEELIEMIKCIDDFSNKLSKIGRSSEAIDVIKSTMKRFKLSDRNRVSLLSILANVYSKNDKYSKKELPTLLKGLKIAQSSKDSISIMNCNIELFEYYSKTNDVEKMKECVEQVEEYMEPQLVMPAYRILSEFAKKYAHWDQYLYLVEKLITSARGLKGQLDQTNIEAIIISYRCNIAQSYMDRGMVEEARKIYDELKQNEYLSFAPTSESKYISVKESLSKEGVQTITVIPKSDTTLPDEYKDADNILVVEFENSYEVKKEQEEEQQVEEQLKQEEEIKEEIKEEVEERLEEVVEKVEEVVEKLEDEVKVEEPVAENVQEVVEKLQEVTEKVQDIVEEAIEKIEDKVETSVETVVEQTIPAIVEDGEEEEVVISSQKFTEMEEQRQEEEEKEQQIQISNHTYEVVPKNIIEKPFAKSVTFENDSSKLNPTIGYLAKVSLYNSDKSVLIDSLYQLVPIEKPKHKLIF